MCGFLGVIILVVAAAEADSAESKLLSIALAVLL
jgi:hypothetical protein